MGQSRSDKVIIKTPPLKISHVNTLPPGLDEGGYDTEGTDVGSSVYGGGLANSSATDVPTLEPPRPGAFVPVLDVPGDFFLVAPIEITVKSQKINVAADGTYTVDVTLAFPDTPNATRYEVRFAT